MLKSLICNDNPYQQNQNFIDTNDNIDVVYKNSEKLYSNHSGKQKIEVFKNKFFGNILTLDDEIQITQYDESNYHEMITHLPLNYIPNATKILILGGGDGGVIKQALKHPNLKEITVVDNDAELINIVKKYFPEFSNSFNNKKVKMIVENETEWINKNSNESFDLIIADSIDLNSNQIYLKIKKILKKNGIFVFNALIPSLEKNQIKILLKDMNKIFKYVKLYQIFQPSIATGHYSFCFCSRSIDPKNNPIDWEKFNNKKIKTN